MRDRASSYEVAVRTIKLLYPNILDVGCFSHTLDHVGEKFHVRTPDEFIKLWVRYFAHSSRVRLEWKAVTGKAMSTYSETRWWSRWEVCSQVLIAPVWGCCSIFTIPS